MASATESPPDLEQGGRPNWAPVPEGDQPTGRQATVRILTRAGVAVLVAAGLFALGHRIPALVLLGVLTLGTAASLRSARVAAAIDRGTRAIERYAGRFLSFVMLGAVNLLVVTPIALLLRLARHDPLALGVSPDAPTFWRPTPQRPGQGTGAGLYRRPFAYERTPRAGLGRGRLPLLRLRAVLGLVTLLVIADVAVGSAINVVAGDWRKPPQNLLTQPDAAAGRAEPWLGALDDELSTVWNTKRYDPFLGWTMPDFSGRHVHVAGGVRRSSQTTPAGSSDPVDVWFFGGSAMFGLYQRDAHTIPSTFARLAGADGVRVRVVNHGALAYTNWQEILLLERLLTSEPAPDVAVFYDGFNEVLSQFTLGPHDEPSHVGAREIEQRLARTPADVSLRTALHDAWAEASASHRVARAIGLARPLGYAQTQVRSAWVAQTLRVEERGEKAAAIHARGVDVARRLAKSYGFSASFFWQPSVYSKRVRPGEEQFEAYLGADPRSWHTADRIARSRLAPGVRDVGDALDGVPGPVMYDFVHTNEAGADAVARRLYAELRPALRRAADRDGT